MSISPDYASYASKMRGYAMGSTDMEVDVRFIDMLAKRAATILDIGCGIGNAVNGLRTRGHHAFGIDPTPEVLEVALDLYDASWFRELQAADITREAMALNHLPQAFDVVLMSGNTPSFMSSDDLRTAFRHVEGLLATSGVLVLGTTTAARGGPVDQDRAGAESGLTLSHRYSDWHLNPYSDNSPWSVSVFSKNHHREFAGGPDGMFVLG